MIRLGVADHRPGATEIPTPDPIADRPAETPPDPPDVVYAPVRISKFVVLDLVTFGVYSIIWFFRSWRWVKQRDESKIVPLGRAIFSPLYFYSLIKDVRRHVDRPLSGGPAIAYFLIVATWRLPDPYWMISLLSFLPLLPTVAAMNSANRGSVRAGYLSKWKLAHVPIVALGGLVLVVATGPTLGLLPSNRVRIEGEIPDRYAEYLTELGLLGPSEEITHFYSPGLFSIKDNGVALTGRRVALYWLDPVTGQLDTASALFGEIVDLEYGTPEGALDNTVVRLYTAEWWFVFVLPPEGGRDRDFIDELERRIEAARPSPLLS